MAFRTYIPDVHDEACDDHEGEEDVESPSEPR